MSRQITGNWNAWRICFYLQKLTLGPSMTNVSQECTGFTQITKIQSVYPYRSCIQWYSVTQTIRHKTWKIIIHVQLVLSNNLPSNFQHEASRNNICTVQQHTSCVNPALAGFAARHVVDTSRTGRIRVSFDAAVIPMKATLGSLGDWKGFEH